MTYRTYDDWKLDSGYESDTCGDAPEPEPVQVKPVKIITNYWAKPIPSREFDWSAVTDDYDGQIDDPVGYGATEAEAIADLQEQLDDA